MDCEDFVEFFPLELIEHIFKFLPARDLANVSLVSKQWRERSNVDTLWLHQCLIRGWMKFGVNKLLLPEQTPPPSSSQTNILGNFPYFEFSEPDDLDLASICEWKFVFIKASHLLKNWQTGRYQVAPILRGHTEKVSAIDCNSDILVSISPDRLMVLWDLATAECKQKLDVHPDVITDVKVHGQVIVTSCNDGVIRVFQVSQGHSHGAIMRMTLAKHDGSADIVDFDGKTVLSVGSDRTMRVWDLTQGKQRFTCLGHHDDIECLHAPRDKNGSFEGLVCTGSWDSSLLIWNIITGQQLHTLTGHTEVVQCCQMDDVKAISGSADCSVKIWSLLSGRCVKTLKGDYGEVYCLKFNDDVIAAGTADSLVMIWTISGEPKHQLRGHLGVVRCLYLDQFKLISGGDQKKINIWNYTTGEKLYTAHRHPTLLHKMLVTDTKIVTASPEKPGTIAMLNFW